jgi:hypothetical protein
MLARAGRLRIGAAEKTEEDEMKFPLWRYGAYAFAVAATLCLAAANVAWAWSLPDGVYRYVMIAVAVAADIGAPCALMAMMHYQGEGDPGSALAAFVVWAFCGYAEVHGAEVWLKSNSFVIASPAMKAGEAQQAAAAELERETANLIEIRGLLARERRRSRLEHLQRREKAALERIDQLRPKTFAATVEPARSQYVGNELALAFALWLLSQVAWRMAVGRLHGTGRAAVRPLGERAQPPARPLVEIASTSVNHPQPVQPDDDPDGGGSGGQPIERRNQPAGCDRFQPASASGSTKIRTPLKLVERRPELDEFQTMVRDLIKAGFSERQIVEKTGRTRHQVREAKRAAVLNWS